MEVPRPTPEQLANLIPALRVAKILGVSKQRVGELADSHPSFPDPICALPDNRGTALYWLPDVEDFAATRNRRPGNPTFRRRPDGEPAPGTTA